MTYMKVNGTRVNKEKYERKLKQLQRQDGKTGYIRASRLGPPSERHVVHMATLQLREPVKRQVYPTLGWVADCGVNTAGMERVPGLERPRCKKCFRTERV